MQASTIIRVARPEDAAHLPAIEQSAGELFRTAPGLEWVAAHGVTPAAFYPPLIAAGTVWVVEAEEGALSGFVSAEVFGDVLHVWELAVSAEIQGRGLGRRLMQAARDHVRAAGLAALTLTTFRDVAWNAPFYERLGYRVLGEAELDERLSGILQGEIERGLPAERRCAMRLDIRGLG
jgi:GNAT superfamily N-acetyltransferase